MPQTKKSTGNTKLDEALGGGIAIRELTSIVADTVVRKSQLTHTLAVNCQVRRVSLNVQTSVVIYII